MENLIITIRKAIDDEGYFYDIYDCDASDITYGDSLDGGHCTTTLENALGMAYKQALEIVKKK